MLKTQVKFKNNKSRDKKYTLEEMKVESGIYVSTTDFGNDYRIISKSGLLIYVTPSGEFDKLSNSWSMCEFIKVDDEVTITFGNKNDK